MTKLLRIDYPGDGYWITSRIANGGAMPFNPDADHVIATWDVDTLQILGGFVTTGYTGRSIQVHMAGDGPGWCTRDLLWNLFNFIFNKLGCEKAFATVSTGNPKAIAMDMRAGWRVETIVKGVYPDGDMMILYMKRATCPWLRLGKRSHGVQEHTVGQP